MIESLAKQWGKRATVSPFERRFYQRDLAAVPRFLSETVFRTLPDIVIRPHTTEEVAAVLHYAHTHRLPVTPRAAASTAYYNSVPTRGGILLDLTGLRGAVAFDREKMAVTVRPATRWLELDEVLRYSYGCALKTYPTSAPGSTVGGWFNMPGLGVGSLRYGLMRELVTCAEAVLPDGQVVMLTPDSSPPLHWFAASEGTLGIITQLELSVRPNPPAEGHHLLAFHDLEALQRVALALTDDSPLPYNLHFADATFYAVLAKAGFRSVSVDPVPEWGHTLRVDYAGETDEVAAGAEVVSQAVEVHGGRELPPALAAEAWADRFSDLRAKRAGPTLLGAELLLPNESLAAFVGEAGRLGRRVGLPVYTYATLAREVGNVNAFFPTDERSTFGYLLDLSLTRRLMDLGLEMGGRPYSLGAWNTFYLGKTSLELAELRRRKQLLDPHDILNPGKVYHAPARLPAPLFRLGMEVLFRLRVLKR
jgi:glycolate oxidase